MCQCSPANTTQTSHWQYFACTHLYIFTHRGVEILIDVAAAAAVILASLCFHWTHVLAKVNMRRNIIHRISKQHQFIFIEDKTRYYISLESVWDQFPELTQSTLNTLLFRALLNWKCFLWYISWVAYFMKYNISDSNNKLLDFYHCPCCARCVVRFGPPLMFTGPTKLRKTFPIYCIVK